MATTGLTPDFSDDATLVAALRDGDEKAFAWLVDTYDMRLRRLAMTFVSTAAVADEVVQETWLGVIKGIDRFEGRSSVKTWLYRILMNIGRTRGVKEKRTAPFSSLGDDERTFSPDRFRPPDSRLFPGHWITKPPAWEEQPAERLAARETIDRVRAAIDDLPDNYRQVITLRDLDGWSAEEVCDYLELTSANQRVLLHRARARVRASLERYFEAAEL